MPPWILGTKRMLVRGQWYAAAAEHFWNPVALGFGIPTMFLIDKKGVCRTVEARENYEDMIPKLLAE